MAIIWGNITETPLPGGRKIIDGMINIGSYTRGTASGVAINMYNYFLSTSNPVVIVGSGGGYNFSHNNGTSTAGLLIAYYNNYNAKNGADCNQAQSEVANTTDLATTEVKIIAIGQAY